MGLLSNLTSCQPHDHLRISTLHQTSNTDHLMSQAMSEWDLQTQSKYKYGMVNPATGRAQELCESRGGRPRLPVPNSPYGFCGRIAALKLTEANPDRLEAEAAFLCACVLLFVCLLLMMSIATPYLYVFG